MTARGKGQRPPGPPTEPLPAVTVAPEFTDKHRCRTIPADTRVVQIVPWGWVLEVAKVARMRIVACPFCGRELEASP